MSRKKAEFSFFASSLHSKKVGTILEIAKKVIIVMQKPVS